MVALNVSQQQINQIRRFPSIPQTPDSVITHLVNQGGVAKGVRVESSVNATTASGNFLNHGGKLRIVIDGLVQWPAPFEFELHYVDRNDESHVQQFEFDAEKNELKRIK